MTYEEKLLEVFARFRGAGVGAETLEQIERACNAEVWSHLPLDVRSSWRLKLAFSDSNPGQVELQPRSLREDGATPAQLEAALRSPFRDEEPVGGGIAGVSMGYDGGNVPAQKAPPAEANPAFERNPIAVSFGGPAPTQASAPVASAPVASAPVASAPSSAAPIDARLIQEQASALGISLPPNASLLGPFLEALAVATEYRARAEAAEGELARLRALLTKA